MQKFIASVFLLMLFVFSCAKRENEDAELATLKMDDAVEVIDIDTLIDRSTVSSICFKGDNRPIITEIDKIAYSDGFFYILSRFAPNKGLYVFDNSGNFVRSIGNEGGGEGAFVIPYDFLLDKTTKQIEILTNGKILYFDIKSGKYLFSKKLELGAVRFAKSSTDYVFVHNGEFTVAFTDHNLKRHPVDYFKKDIIHSIQPYTSFWSDDNNKIYFHRDYENLIYLIDGKEFRPHYSIDFGETPVTDDVKSKIKDPIEISTKLADLKLKASLYFETSDYIHFTYAYNNKLYLVLHSKKNSSTKILDVNNVKNNLTQEKRPPYVIGTTNDGYFLGLIMQERAAVGVMQKFGCDSTDIKNFVIVKYKYKF
jgi:hypothetical protein